MAPPSRRRILPSKTLATFGAVHLYPPLPSKSVNHDSDGSLRAAPSATTTIAHDDQPSSATTPFSANGIQIGGWKITTQNSSIGDEKSMEELTLMLEDVANNNPDGDEDDPKTEEHGTTGRKRRLCPPEITFLDAIVSFQYQKESTLVDAERNCEATTEVRFSARDALLEWAEAHRYLEMHPHENSALSSMPSRDDEIRGVSIMRTVDAKIWSNKPQNNIDAAATDYSSNSEFYYDWTFSSPYAGTIIPQSYSHTIDIPTAGSVVEKKDDTINNREQWKPLQQSHIPFHLLQDTNQPILLYDDIHLYEDDLHDNGDVSLNIKIRVMPRCWYVLQRLFMRVDHVCVKCREARYFCLLDDNDSSSSSLGGNNVQRNTIYRDVIWKQAKWEELGRLGLPTDPAAWREDGNNAGVSTAALGMMPLPPPPLASLLTRLPVVPLPIDLSSFAYFDADSD